MQMVWNSRTRGCGCAARLTDAYTPNTRVLLSRWKLEREATSRILFVKMKLLICAKGLGGCFD